MPASHASFRRHDRPEPKALVVVISALQLGLVVLVWLLALLPVAVMALVAMGVQGLRGAGSIRPPTSEFRP
jgi:hypothetical protein